MWFECLECGLAIFFHQDRYFLFRFRQRFVAGTSQLHAFLKVFKRIFETHLALLKQLHKLLKFGQRFFELKFSFFGRQEKYL